MSHTRITVLTALAMIAFASNSLLCRIALESTAIDPASFTTLRLTAGAVTLWLIVRMRHGSRVSGGSWLSALALFSYAAGFSYAYMNLSTATGALLLFGAVQATMVGYALRSGERLQRFQVSGFVLALVGIISLLLPGLSAPPLFASLLMLGAGVASGIYSLRGKSVDNPTTATAGNFLRTVPIAATLSLLMHDGTTLDSLGFWYAVFSGALASGIGYVIWYMALLELKATTAAIVQLSVPVIAAFGGIVFLGESITLRLALASLATLGGIALVILESGKPEPF